ncbi:FmdB family zinc ribbon protein [Saccharopolyspora oryzae]|uniref:Zinc ribbon domain-containing protein n=1 Tax=Saccharopolyspora oryzae TaxID=2997343 RepID=A0ABT4VA58_9PSEU|nr:FmdB family zinc ribbon protein [Saccharopolyspora oryzae]MDA3630286.1 zinc ribbon domain-containing protein [Saccharopolyspora oryzae]
MATYEYDCPRCGRFETRQPMGTAADSHTCPTCLGNAHRVFSAPHLNAVPEQLSAALAREERSRAEPEVVTEVPDSPSRLRP